jgi:hypothetical protein
MNLFNTVTRNPSIITIVFFSMRTNRKDLSIFFKMMYHYQHSVRILMYSINTDCFFHVEPTGKAMKRMGNAHGANQADEPMEHAHQMIMVSKHLILRVCIDFDHVLVDDYG